MSKPAPAALTYLGKFYALASLLFNVVIDYGGSEDLLFSIFESNKPKREIIIEMAKVVCKDIWNLVDKKINFIIDWLPSLDELSGFTDQKIGNLYVHSHARLKEFDKQSFAFFDEKPDGDWDYTIKFSEGLTIAKQVGLKLAGFRELYHYAFELFQLYSKDTVGKHNGTFSIVSLVGCQDIFILEKQSYNCNAYLRLNIDFDKMHFFFDILTCKDDYKLSPSTFILARVPK